MKRAAPCLPRRGKSKLRTEGLSGSEPDILRKKLSIFGFQGGFRLPPSVTETDGWKRKALWRNAGKGAGPGPMADAPAPRTQETLKARPCECPGWSTKRLDFVRNRFLRTFGMILTVPFSVRSDTVCRRRHIGEIGCILKKKARAGGMSAQRQVFSLKGLTSCINCIYCIYTV